MRRSVKASLLAGMIAGMIPAASAAPPGFGMSAGDLRKEDGGKLYASGKNAEGALLCVSAECLAATPPLLAPADAKPEGLFTIVQTSAGQRQWAYDGKPLHTHETLPADQVDPWMPLLESVRIKDVVAEGFALAIDNPTLVAKPAARRDIGAIMTEYYPAASLRAQEQGEVVPSFCVDKEGRPFDVKLERSSGFARLDEATLKFLPRTRLEPAKDANGAPVAVCRHRFGLVWAIH